MMGVKICLVFFVSASFFWNPSAFGEDVGLVKRGAFLLSLKPDTFRDGIKVHSLIGYLPTGTRISIGTKKEITNLKTTEEELYYRVKSEMGTSGWLRSDLFIASSGRKLAISIASFDIAVHQPDATLQKPFIRFRVGRYGGNYFEVTGETEEGFYDVVLHRAHYKASGLPATENARLKKLYVRNKQVSLLDPEDSELLADLNRRWLPLESSDESFLMEMSSKLTEKLGADIGDINQILENLNDLQCIMGASAQGELGFRIFSNGFSLKLDASIKEASTKYIFEKRKLEADKIRRFSGLGVVKCDGTKPIRLEQYSLQENFVSKRRRFSVRLEDLEASNSKWINTLQGEEVSNKMVRISGWDDYHQLIAELNSRAKIGQSYLAELPEKERMFLLNYIIMRIGYFEHRKFMIDAS